MMRLFVVATLLLAAGCSTAPCKGNGLFLTIDYGDAAAADRIVVESLAADGTLQLAGADHTPGQRSGSVQVWFDKGYPAGQQRIVSVVALIDEERVGVGSTPETTLAERCQALSLTLTPCDADADPLEACTTAPSLDIDTAGLPDPLPMLP
jgi:hypothetical protein